MSDVTETLPENSSNINAC